MDTMPISKVYRKDKLVGELPSVAENPPRRPVVDLVQVGGKDRKFYAAVVLPKDYTLVLSRVMFIGKQAKNPNAAKLWVDYILSVRGQKLIGSDVELFSIRNDVDAEYTAASLTKQLGSGNVKPIPVSAEIVTYLDQKKRLDFLNAWKAAVAAGASGK